jgi:opacity protein-like surface antigen
MKTKVIIASALLAVLSLTGISQEKEKRLSFEINGGPSFPINEFVEGIRMGFGFECTFRYSIMPHTGIYAGWGANWLSTESAMSENNMDYEETGYVLGLDFRHPINNSNVSYYVRAGALYNHIETENSDGEIISDSGHGLGYQIAGGLDVSLGNNWSITPGLKFNSIMGESTVEGITTELKYQYISARIGILKRF